MRDYEAEARAAELEGKAKAARIRAQGLKSKQRTHAATTCARLLASARRQLTSVARWLLGGCAQADATPTQAAATCTPTPAK